MTHKEEQIEKWAAEVVIDEMVANDYKTINTCPHYHAYVELFRKFHKDFLEQQWAEYITLQLQEL